MPLYINPIPPLSIPSDSLPLFGAGGQALTANVVYLYAFVIQTSITITALRWRPGSTATGTSNIGVYTFAGNLLVDSGAITNTANTVNTATLGTPLALSAGQYYLAIGCSNSTDTYRGIASNASALTALTSYKQAANSIATNALPATLGAITNNPSTGVAMSAVISGGLT